MLPWVPGCRAILRTLCEKEDLVLDSRLGTENRTCQNPQKLRRRVDPLAEHKKSSP